MGVETRLYREMYLTDLLLPRAIGLRMESSAMFTSVSKPAGVERAGPPYETHSSCRWTQLAYWYFDVV